MDPKNLRDGLISAFLYPQQGANVVFIVRLSLFSFVLHLQYGQLLQVQKEHKAPEQLETTSPPCERSGSAAGREGWGSPAELALMRPQQVVAPGGNVL